MQAHSLHGFFLNSAHTLRGLDQPFLMKKVQGAYTNISFGEVLSSIDAIASTLHDMGLRKGDRVAFILENSPEYILFDQACLKLGLVNASLYPTLSESEIEYILKDSESKAILVGTPFLLRRILGIDERGTSLQHIFTVFDTESQGKVMSAKNVIEHGKQKHSDYASTIQDIFNSIHEHDLASLIYTSGTTGVPKGVMLSHGNFMSNAKAAKTIVSNIGPDDVFLSFLPLCHVFERLATYYLSTYI
ncbi:MAG: AMP-binding protein, partial [Ignavibacteria bacterium]